MLNLVVNISGCLARFLGYFMIIGVELNRKPVGGDIKIHGYRNGLGFIGKFIKRSDWTPGSIALTNKNVDELYKSMRIETLIENNPIEQKT